MNDTENAATVSALAELLVEFTGRPDIAIRSMARKLGDAGMLPKGSEPITVEHAANFIVAAVGSVAASQAVEAVRTIGGAPLWRRDKLSQRPDGGVSVESELAEEIQIPLGSGKDWARVSQNLVGALGYFIETSRDHAGVALLESINIRRCLSAPYAILKTRVVPLDAGLRQDWLSFGNGSAEATPLYAVANLRMGVNAIAPGVLISVIGDLLAGRLRSPIATQPVAVPAPQDVGAS